MYRLLFLSNNDNITNHLTSYKVTKILAEASLLTNKFHMESFDKRNFSNINDVVCTGI